MATTLVLLSGGLDSATALAATVNGGGSCRALFVAYGQSAEREEALAATAIARWSGVPLTALTLEGLGFGVGEIRGRNAFLLQAALLAAPPGPSTLVLSIHAGTPYADCTPEFVRLMQRSFAFQTGGEVTVAAPFIDMSKGDIFVTTRALEVPVDLTYSCERAGGPCAECLSCQDRERLDEIA